MKVERINALCACGCGGEVGWNVSYKRWNRFVQGHHARGKDNPFYKKGRFGTNNPKYGKHHTKEFCKAASARMKIRMTGENNPMFGTKRPEMVGKNNPMRRPEVIVKFMDENNPNWQGGIAAEPYCDIWLDQDYKESILERDSYECQNPGCWKTSIRLCLHHIDYIKKNCDPWNLLTLCLSCNSRANFDKECWQALYQSIMEEKYGYEQAC
jgi:hypothetical protein